MHVRYKRERGGGPGAANRERYIRESPGVEEGKRVARSGEKEGGVGVKESRKTTLIREK